MGKSKAAALKKKKKGPKGKKARAKAKLERQWGEHVDEEVIEGAKIRIGKSRLVKNSSTATTTSKVKKQKQENNWEEEEEEEEQFMDEAESGDDESMTSSSDEEDSDDDDGGGGGGGGTGQQQVSSLNALLQSIQSKAKRDKKVSGLTSTGGGGHKRHEKSQMLIDNDDEEEEQIEDDDVVSTASSSSDNNSTGDESSSSSNDAHENNKEAPDIEDDDDDEEENNEIKNKKSILNPYDAHFTKSQPLPEQKEQQTTFLSPFLTTKKVVVPSKQQLLDSSLEIHLSQSSSLDSMLNEQQQQKEESKDIANANPTPTKKSKKKKKKNQIQEEKEQPQPLLIQWKELGQTLYQQYVRKVLQHYWIAQNKRVVKHNVDGIDDDEKEEDYQGVVKKKEIFSTLQSVILPSLINYMDLYLPIETRKNRDALDNILSLHILNHVLTSRSRVIRHDRRIKEKEQQQKQNDDDDDKQKRNHIKHTNDDEDEDKWRDQGYTRPKVLVLLPTRGVAHSFLHRLLSLMGTSVNVQELDRFDIDYGPPPSEEEDDIMAARRRKAVQNQKGKEWLELFGDDVNTDDEFKMGISLTPNAVIGKNKRKKNSSGGKTGVAMKLYAEFYKSDIILASPLGLKMATTSSNDDDDEDDEEAGGDIDYLSSIEICLLYKCQTLLMQNWDHVNSVLDKINKHISKSNETDFGRVREYQLAGQSKHWRQLIMMSEYMDPYMTSTFKRYGQSAAGRLKLLRRVAPDEANLCDVLVKVRQVFTRIPASSFQNQCQDKLSYFQNKVLPQIQRLKQSRTIIYVPSYFDYISLRNLLMKVGASFVSVTEYSRVKARFSQGRKSMLLYTGRAHYFMRHIIKGARHIILFGLPENGTLYPDLVNMLMTAPGTGGGNGMDSDEDGLGVEAPLSCLALFTKYDALALERIVGTGHCERMVKGEKSTFLFCS